jgi:ribosome-binding protein aMBF1 (putative translation factor)
MADRTPTTDAAEILRRRRGWTEENQVASDRYREELDIAQAAYDLRAAAGLTQVQLARMIGTSASVINRVEEADYPGQSLTILRRIAAALGKRVVVHVEDVEQRAAA